MSDREQRTVRGATDRRRRAAVVVLLLVLAPVAVLSVAVGVHGEPFPAEVGYVRWLQGLGGPVPRGAELVRLATGTEPALVVAALAAAAEVWRRRRRAAVAAVAAAVAITATTLLVVQPLLKDVVDRPRPSAELVEVRASSSSMSYPSGHSMSTTTVWGAMVGVAWRRRRRRLAVAAAAPIVATFFSSAVQGVHWPTDALAGTALGATAAWLVVHVLTPYERPNGDVRPADG